MLNYYSFVGTTHYRHYVVELMCLFSADKFEGEVIECDEGDLFWVEKEKVPSLPTWGVVKTAVNILSEYGNNNYILKNTFTPGESIVLDKMGAGDEGHKFKIVMEGAAAAGEKN